MKRLYFLLMLLAVLNVSAEVRSDNEMQQLAANALLRTKGNRVQARVQASEPLVRLMDMPQIALFGYADAGWAMVPKDDRFGDVIAYSDGSLEKSSTSPEFQWLMRSFDEGMAEDLRTGRNRRAAARQVSSALHKVAPLLKTTWDQGWPYNTKCPSTITPEGERQTICGCVATAFGMVFHHLQLPKKMHGKSSYLWKNIVADPEKDGPRVLSYDYGRNPFDWEHITVSYQSGKSTQAEVDAIGNLIYAIGVMAKMDYKPGASGSYTADVVRSINNICEDLRAIDHGYNNMDLNVIARELNEGRPVVFAGADAEGGHCFVIDGADNKGFLHCNLGWSGAGNDYFAHDVMAGYVSNQQLTTVFPFNNMTAAQPMEELRGYAAVADDTQPVTELEPNTWYVMWNEGRATYLNDHGKNLEVGTTNMTPDGRLTEYHAGTLVRLVPNSTNRFYIQTGLGNYLPSFAHNATGKTAATKSATYSVSTIYDKEGNEQPGHFCLLSSSNVRMDCNGANIVGWNTGLTTEVGGNASWQFFPVTLTERLNEDPATLITLDADTLRLLVGNTRQLTATYEPALVTIPYAAWNSSKTSYATVDEYGRVKAVAKGSSVISATTIDGSNLSDQCVVLVGTSTQRKLLTALKNTAVYTLNNVGLTNGYLIATDTTAYPHLRGITATQTAGCKDPIYWEDAELGTPNTLWQILKSMEGQYYIYNVGKRQFLVSQGDETEYIFSNDPKPISLELVAADDFNGAADLVGNFYINGGSGESSRLIAGTNSTNPAHWMNSTSSVYRKLSVWCISEVAGLSTGLSLLSQTDLEAILDPTAITAPVISDTQMTRGTYDLQGRSLQSPSRQHGILIQNGIKIIR